MNAIVADCVWFEPPVKSVHCGDIGKPGLRYTFVILTSASLTMAMKTLIALVLLFGSLVANAEPCSNGSDETRITGVSQCLLVRHFGPPGAEHLLVWLHGDVSGGGPAKYHLPIVQRTTEALAAEKVSSVALIRPGYSDGSGESSSVDPLHDGRSDHYTRENVSEVAAAIRNLKSRYQSKRVTVIGHSGGAATTAVILGMEPGLVDSAVLVSCPCDLVAWRANRRAWSRSENPMGWTEKVVPSSRVIALTGSRDDNTVPDLAKRYVDALIGRGVPARFTEIPYASHNEALKVGEVTEAITELLHAP